VILLAIALGLLVAALQYGHGALAPRLFPLALLRVLAGTVIAAVLLDVPVGRAHLPQPEVALDASMSWLRAAPGCTAWTAALDSAARIGHGRWFRFGDSLRADVSRIDPIDQASSLRAVADRGAGTGRPLVVLTDGELDDAELLSTLPRGSRVVAMPCTNLPDVAVANLEAPRTVLAGDSVAARVTIVAGGAGAPASRVELRLDDALVAASDLSALAPYAELPVELRGLAGGADRAAVLRAVVRAPGDREPRNDTLAVAVDVSRAAAAVFASTAPDYDAREAVAALRSVTSLPTRAFYRVAPGMWRTDGALARVSEADVASALRGAPLAVIHGDTSLFGAPRAATSGSLLLFAPPAASQGEWYASTAPPSPLAPVLASLPFDSLPPLDVSPSLPRASWQGLVTHRGGAPQDRRAALVGWDAPRRVALLGAGGFWRWRFRGGVRAEAYDAFFGSLYDWLVEGRADRRAAMPANPVLRAGDPIRWRRGATRDSVVDLTITRRSATGRVYSVLLHFPDTTTIAESPPLVAGMYEVRMEGGRTLLPVNVSRELLPRRASVRSGAVGGTSVAGEAPTARDVGWLLAVAVVLLCAEWLLRRRAGLR
jgi:hypothetical protein